LLLEILTRRYYRIRNLESFNNLIGKHHIFVTAHYTHPIDGIDIHVASTFAEYSHLAEAGEELSYLVKSFPQEHDTVIDIYIWSPEKREIETVREEIQAELNRTAFPRPIRRIVVSVAGIETIKGMEGMWHFTFRHTAEGYQEEKVYRGLHPMMGKRLHLWRLVNFNIERLPSVEDVYLFKVNAKENPKDERVFAIAEVRDMTVIRDKDGKIAQIPYLEHMLFEAAASIRQVLSQRPPKERPQWNRLLLYIWPTFDFNDDELNQIALKLSSATEGLGLERIVIRCKLPDEHTGSLKDTILRISNPGGLQPVVSFHAPADHPLRPLSEYERKVQQLRRRGLLSPYEIVEMLTSSRGEKLQFPPGEFTEYDLNEQNQLVPVSRPYGLNRANLVVGVIRNFTTKYPEGMARVVMLGDPSKGMGSIAEAECRRIMACIDLAAELKLPLEWFPVSAGAKISMESGTENMDWIAAVLRELIKFTQAGGEINIVVNGINVGAQPYWNAESTMLMHTRGILIMTPEGAMVLTGKRALDFSGSVSADDNFGIGGYDRVMGQNGQAQYWAENIVEACEILLRHYDHTYVVPGERFPRDSSTSDSKDRDIRSYPYNASKADGFTVVGEIFTEEHNAGRKRPFDIRSVMRAVIDQDHQPLERWAGFRDAEIPVVWDAHLGGHPVCLIGMESHPLPRLGFISADGPYQWTAGTLFPSGSKKVARTINSVSGNRPLVVLANLSGFDGSPESMRKWQLEFGAEIGRAVVNFKGPMVFCVVSRYHGGAYVVFSKTLNEQLEVAALEGSFASVIGGAPAAAVVFAGDVEKRTREDERLVALEKAIAAAEGAEKGRLRAEYNELTNIVYSEKLGQVAEEFDTIHSIHRALQVGSLDRIISSSNLRPYLIDAVERGIQRTLEKEKK
ncbi:MAG: carbamoyl-phosphate synthase subunit L, partial [Blastocatellia bacterium]|nr:carbamoyl-phosphate synthase subunit L [Blastocatellia bacterium]